MYTKASLHNQNQTLRHTTPPRRTPVNTRLRAPEMFPSLFFCSSFRRGGRGLPTMVLQAHWRRNPRRYVDILQLGLDDRRLRQASAV